MIPSLVKGRYIIRFCVVAEHANEADIGKQMLQSSCLLQHCFLLNIFLVYVLIHLNIRQLIFLLHIL